jgi:sugar O-acyltransferase (sialic acid O-acetyltransferase NeuD family)
MYLYGIFGTGGFAREVMPVCRKMLAGRHAGGKYELVFVSDTPYPHSHINQQRVLSESEFLSRKAVQRFYSIAIGDSKLREKIAGSIIGATPFSIIADNHVAGDENETGEGAIFCPFSSVTSNTRIGRFFQANIYSYVAHDCTIGDFVTLAPGVKCNGSVRIASHAYIGTGAIIKQGTPTRPIVIGEGAVVGMGAVVTKSVAEYTTVVGNPAKELSKF